MTDKPLQSCMACWQPMWQEWDHLPMICPKCQQTFTPIQRADLYERWRTRKSVEELTAVIRDLLKQAKETAQAPLDDFLDGEEWKRGRRPEDEP
jgi:predicted amidophosphoribosyltransferase